MKSRKLWTNAETPIYQPLKEGQRYGQMLNKFTQTSKISGKNIIGNSMGVNLSTGGRFSVHCILGTSYVKLGFHSMKLSQAAMFAKKYSK